jgi:PAS domain S-box-containing protein
MADDDAGLYRQAFLNSRAVKLLIDPATGAIVDANPAAAAFYGYSRDALRQKAYADVNTLAADEVTRCLSQAANEERSVFVAPQRIASGDIRTVEIYAGVVFLGGRRLLHAIIHDITERARTERALRAIVEGTVVSAGEEFFPSLARHLAIALDARYAFVAEIMETPGRARARAFWLGDQFREPFEYPLAGTPCELVIGGGGVCYFPAGVQALFPEDRGLVNLEVESYLGMAFFDNGGRPLGHLAVMDSRPMGDELQNLSILKIFAARAGAELERQRAEEALRESERQYRTLIEQSNDAIYLLNNGKFEITNRRFREMLGVTQQEVLSADFDFMELVAPESVPIVAERVEMVDAGITPSPQYEFLALARDGTRIPVEASVTYIEYRGGIATQGILRDITGRRDVENTLRRRAEELAALHATFVDISTPHDLPSVLETIVERAVRLLEAHRGDLYLCDPERREVRCVVSFNAAAEYTGNVLSYGQGVPGLVAEGGKPVILADYSQWDPLLEDQPGPAAVLGVPMTWQGEVAGVIQVFDNRGGRRFDEGHLELITLFANQAMIAVENTRLLAIERQQRELSEARLAELRSRERFLLLLHDLTRTALETRDFEPMLERVAAKVAELFLAQACFVSLWDEERGISVPAASFGVPTVVYQQFTAEPGEEALTLRALEGGRPLAVEDVLTTSFLSPRIASHVPMPSALVLPLIAAGERLGAVVVAFAERHAFTPSEIAQGEQAAGQIALAVAEARLLVSEREQRALAEALRESGVVLSSTLDFEAVLDRLLDQIGTVVAYDAGNVALVENGRTRIARMRGYERFGPHVPALVSALQLPIAETPNLSLMAETARPMVVSNTHEDPNWLHLEASEGTGSWAGAPIIVHGEVIAFFSLDKAEPGFYRQEDAKRLAAFAGQAGLALQNARLFAEAGRRARELNLLNRVIAAAASARDELDVLTTGCYELAHFFGVPQAALALLDADGQTATVVAEFLAPGRPSGMGARIPMASNPALGPLLESAQPVAIYDVATHPVTRPILELLAQRGSLSILIVPIVVRGQVVGTLGIDSLTYREFSAEEIGLAKTVGEQLGRALETARLYDQLRAHAAELEQRVLARTRELAEANVRLLELDRLKSKFVSDVSHELRTPITNLALYLELLRRGKPEKRETYLTVLSEQAGRLGRLVEDILNLSRLELGRDKLQLVPVELNSLVRQIVGSHRLRAEAKGLALRFVPAADLPVIGADAGQLTQVLSNLLANAVNYTEKGSIHLRTRVGAGGEVGLEIRDTGSGIDPDDMPHLFERFYRGRHISQSNIPGSGLGLAIVKEIVDLHGGRIEVSSQPNNGSTFTVWLPALMSGAEAARQPL